jgi:hypothetical protein
MVYKVLLRWQSELARVWVSHIYTWVCVVRAREVVREVRAAEDG